MKKLQHKILISFIVILLLLAGLGGLSFFNLHSSNENVENMISRDLELLVSSENISQNIAERISSVRAYALYDRSTYRMQYTELTENSLELSEELLTAGKGTNRLSEIEELLELTNAWSTFIEETVLPSITSGDSKVAHEQLQQAEVQAVQLMHRFNKLSEDNQSMIKEAGHSVLEGAERTEQIILITVISSLVLGMVIAFFSAQGIVKPILQVVNRLKQIAKGDLNGEELKTRAKDELGSLVNSTNAMVKSLRTLVTKTNQSSEQIAASAEELTAS
ncbi:MCP four helix bundle domain-containing protein, partial [Pueribacillus sp. YX66]|uniref:MCP four helix bundle domain-containing protein n=1 Tax=Pueribacillus sp. YX66 TaxID=3229242 RepID=UPI00358D0EBB